MIPIRKPGKLIALALVLAEVGWANESPQIVQPNEVLDQPWRIYDILPGTSLE